MREIKFRAWDVESHHMFSDVYVHGNSVATSIVKDDWNHKLIPMQFTGLKDKNGKEIYEGDVVKCYTTEINYEVLEVKWNETLTGFSPFVEQTPVAADSYSEWVWKEIEIIGNTHENPELLEKDV